MNGKRKKSKGMKIELIVKWADRKKEIDEDAYAKRLISGEENPEDSLTFTYDPLVIDVEDISGFNKLDEEFTIVRTYTQEAYCVKMKYENFKRIYAQTSGQTIMEIRTASTEEDSSSKILE